MEEINLEELWPARDAFGDRLPRPWVVDIVGHARGKAKPPRDRKIVRATTREGAIRTAREYSYMKRGTAHARLAHPVKDLGMKAVKNKACT